MQAPPLSLDLKPAEASSPGVDTRRGIQPVRPDPHAQSTQRIIMIVPIGFQRNVETALDNYFMQDSSHTLSETERASRVPPRTQTRIISYLGAALDEFSMLHLALTKAGVEVVLFSSERAHNTPDAIFPNNWFSTHAPSEVVQFPSIKD